MQSLNDPLEYCLLTGSHYIRRKVTTWSADGPINWWAHQLMGPSSEGSLNWWLHQLIKNLYFGLNPGKSKWSRRVTSELISTVYGFYILEFVSLRFWKVFAFHFMTESRKLSRENKCDVVIKTTSFENLNKHSLKPVHTYHLRNKSDVHQINW